VEQWVTIGDERGGAPTIADYALLGNCQGSALVSRSGSIDWACLPALDSPAFFARILGEPGGYWSIRPRGPAESTREYADDTMVLTTRFRTPSGVVTLTDFMPLDERDLSNDIGLHSPSAILRIVECESGSMDLDVEIAIRPEFGLTTPLVERVDERTWRTRGGPLAVAVHTNATLEMDGAILRGELELTTGDVIACGLETGDPWGPLLPLHDHDEILDARETTITGWRSWARKLVGYEGDYRGLLRRSAVVLRALNYAPTGAIVAAPTTSLPEEIGGVRNWDYRYTWVRDASFTIGALAASGCGFEATRFFDFFGNATAGSLASGQGLQIMYGIRGERFIPEHELDTMQGHRDSRPVRIGNGAWNQTQLDVYGELLDAAWQIHELDIEIDAALGEFLANVADRAALRWRDIDEGIWEVRGGAGHFLYSKLMNWVALDRAVRLAPSLDTDAARVSRWEAERDRIREAILTEGWSESAGAYIQAFGREELDASVLMMPLVGFLPADDPRMLATIEAISERLTDDHGFVFRYLSEDGLPGGEGTFGICTFWLAECLALAGQRDRARALFTLMADCANDVGLLAEEIDPESRELLGNFPQAFTHIGLIHAAIAIESAASTMSRTARAERG
jgi:GH15 family glucan-1,4-alpha-glucosidase